MGDQVGTREQPSDRDPGGLCAEHWFLLAAIVSLTAAVAAYVLDATLPIELDRGAYAIMVACFVAGYCGWLSRSAERRMRRNVGGELRRLRAQVARQRTTYVPAPRRPDEGQRYVSAVASGQGDMVPLMPAVAPEAEAALRRLNMRLLNGGNELH